MGLGRGRLLSHRGEARIRGAGGGPTAIDARLRWLMGPMGSHPERLVVTSIENIPPCGVGTRERRPTPISQDGPAASLSVKHQRPQFNALARRRIGWRRRIDKGGVRPEAGPAVG